MKTKKLLFSLCLAMLAPHAFATGEAEQASKDNAGIAEISASEAHRKRLRRNHASPSAGMAKRYIAGTFIATAIYVIAVRIDIKTKHTDVSTFLMSY